MNKDIGRLLKKKREEKNISLEETQRVTKMQISLLRDLEEGPAFDRLEPVYLKSFVKIYSKFLGLDLDLLLKDLEVKSESKPKVSPQKIKENMSPLFATNRFDFKLPKLPFPIKDLIKYAGISLLIIILIFTFSKVFSRKQKVKVRKEYSESISDTPTQDFTQTSIPISDKLILVIRATEDCWLKVMADSKVVFQRVLTKGSVEKWEAKERVELWVGNAAGLKVELNGQNIGPLGRRGQVVKNIVMTKEGVTIGK